MNVRGLKAPDECSAQRRNRIGRKTGLPENLLAGKTCLLCAATLKSTLVRWQNGTGAGEGTRTPTTFVTGT
jgi:hypothetical protein